MSFDSYLDEAWNTHARQPARVAASLQAEGLPMAQTDEQVAQLAFLAQHVQGQHLGLWAEGLAFQRQLAALPQVEAGGATAQALQRHATVLQLAAGTLSLPPDTPASEHARLQALTAAQLAYFGPERALSLLQAAEAACAALPDTDPAVRALAASANNAAGALHDEATLSPAQQALMLHAAALSHRSWARAGTWLELERADYRLALCHARAGHYAAAYDHAHACLARVQLQEPAAPALEHFFGWEALARVAAKAGNEGTRQQAAAEAQTWFARLAEADQTWCRPALQGLEPRA